MDRAKLFPLLKGVLVLAVIALCSGLLLGVFNYITYVDPTSEKDSTIITFRGKWKGDNAYYDPERNVSVVEFDAKISHGKRIDTVCEIIE